MTLAALALILVVAAYVRLAHPELSWFGIDQARDAYTALGIVSGRALPLLGVEIAGGPAHTWGPAYFYLIAIPFAVSRDPTVAVTVLSATTIAAVLMTYRLGRDVFGREVGLLAAALVAPYPLAVIEAKALWNVAPVSLFAVGFFHALCALTIQGRSAMVIPTAAALAVLLQLHLSALSLVVVLAFALALFRPAIRGIHLAGALGMFVALMLPYLLAQWLSGLADFRAAVSTGGVLRWRSPWELGELALRVLLASPDVVAGIPALHETWHPGLLQSLHRLEATMLVLGLAFCGLAVVWRVLSRGPRDGPFPGMVLVTLGFAVPLLMLGVRWDVKSHYLNVAYPMPFIAAALLLSRAIDRVGAVAGGRARRALWAALATVTALTVALQVDFHRQHWRTIQSTGASVWTPGRLELMAIRYKAELARVMVQDFGADSRDVFRRVHGSRAHDWLEDGGYFFESTAGALPRPARPPDPSLHYVVLRDEADAGTLLAGRIARAGPYAVVEYRPLIEYSTWQCARPDAGAQRGGGAIVSCRGTISGRPPSGRRFEVVVSLRAAMPGNHAVDALHLNGVSVPASRVLAHSTFSAHTVDAIFDVTPHVRDGPNELSLLMSGGTSRVDLDVYEIRG